MKDFLLIKAQRIVSHPSASDSSADNEGRCAKRGAKLEGCRWLSVAKWIRAEQTRRETVSKQAHIGCRGRLDWTAGAAWHSVEQDPRSQESCLKFKDKRVVNHTLQSMDIT